MGDKIIDYEGWYNRLSTTVLEWEYLVLENKRLLLANQYLEQYDMTPIAFEDQSATLGTLEETLSTLDSYIDSLHHEVYDGYDKNFMASVSNGSVEALSRIHMEDFTVTNTIELKETEYWIDVGQTIMSREVVKEKLDLSDFVGYSADEMKRSHYVKEFAEIYKKDFEEYGDADLTLLEKIETFYKGGEYEHKKYQPDKVFWSNLLDIATLGIKPLIEYMAGTEFITDEDLSELEKNAKGVEGALTILMTALTLTSAGTIGAATRIVLCDIAADIAVTGASNVMLEMGVPVPMVIILSIGAGMGLAKVADKLVFSIGGKMINAEGKNLQELIKILSIEDLTTLIKETKGMKQFTDIIKNLDASKLKQVIGKVNDDVFENVIKSMSSKQRSELLKVCEDDLAKRIKNVYEGGSKPILNSIDKAKLDAWKYRPTDKDYLKYKNIFDDSNYYNQATGECIYPGMKNPETGVADINTNGFMNGKSDLDVISKGRKINRYGDNGNARYFSPENTSFEQRALPPGTENKKPVEIEVLKDIPCSSGEIAPWFGQPGGGIQYFTNVKIKALDGSMVDATMENLELNKYIKITNK